MTPAPRVRGTSLEGHATCAEIPNGRSTRVPCADLKTKRGNEFAAADIFRFSTRIPNRVRSREGALIERPFSHESMSLKSQTDRCLEETSLIALVLDRSEWRIPVDIQERAISDVSSRHRSV